MASAFPVDTLDGSLLGFAKPPHEKNALGGSYTHAPLPAKLKKSFTHPSAVPRSGVGLLCNRNVCSGGHEMSVAVSYSPICPICIKPVKVEKL
jgi:hypothetical protein